MVDQSIVGTEFEPFAYRVEKNKIMEYCLAVGDDNPIFWDEKAAQEAGHPDTPTPLTFQTLFVFWGFPQIWQRMEEVGIDTGKLLHLKEDYDYHKPIYPGMMVHGQTKVDEVKTGKMNTVTFTTDFKDDQGDMLISAHMTIVIRQD